MRPASRLEEGVLFQQRYRIEKLIGVGGMGYVYLASDSRLMGKFWAIKESIPIHYNREHLLLEAKWLTELRHPNLPLIVDFYPPYHDEHAYMVMEYIEGETVQERISREPISFKESIEICLQLCDALIYLHSHQPSIIYRDMKPSNVMLTRTQQVKLIDFGIAREHKADVSSDTVKLGTLGFAAPEQYEDVQSDARTDLYGVGALMAYILTDGEWQGIATFRSSMLRSDIPNGVAQILSKLLAKKPEDRYQDASQLKADLMAYVDPMSNLLGQGYDARGQSVPTGGLNKGIIIACMSCSEGMGCTHAAIMIANALSRIYRGRVAFVDYSPIVNSVVEQMSLEIDGEDNDYQVEQLLRYQGVEYRHASNLNRQYNGHFMPYLMQTFDYIVLDLGAIQGNGLLDEFMRANYSLLIGSAAMWRQQEWTNAIERLDSRSFKQWIGGVPHADDRELRSCPARLHSRLVVSIPTCPNPFQHHDRVEVWMDHWFNHSAKRKRRFKLNKWLG
ncbi:serine/threonine protein kinase [Paenibacillus sp. 1001270B_150601_E10]|uniref:serine/threonine protein kinase n=1 Tax=Paenibacillus sp. 1001270B_150601_E10 TaxID=2787079 RepID=UPI00189D383C|nr:serine/threonine-protein kinase [Paenibacillus sp. 1001270B_150601_E10]